MTLLAVGTMLALSMANAESAVNVELEMSNTTSHVLISTEKKSELQQFAGWFGQDYTLFFTDFYQGAAKYFATLPTSRREILRSELHQFLEDNVNSSPKKLVGEWIKLGAQTWDSGLEIRPALEDFLFMLGDKYDLSFVNDGIVKQ